MFVFSAWLKHIPNNDSQRGRRKLRKSAALHSIVCMYLPSNQYRHSFENVQRVSRLATGREPVPLSVVETKLKKSVGTNFNHFVSCCVLEFQFSTCMRVFRNTDLRQARNIPRQTERLCHPRPPHYASHDPGIISLALEPQPPLPCCISSCPLPPIHCTEHLHPPPFHG